MAADIGGMELAALAATAAWGGFMRGFAGFATTLFMVPLFSMIIDPAVAVLTGLTLDAIATAPLFPNAARQASWRMVMPVLLGGIAAIPLGTYALLIADASTMRIAIAAVVIASALLMLSGWSYRGRRSPLTSFLVGGIAGTMGSATGIGGPPIAVYFLASATQAKEIRAMLNVYSFVRISLSAAAIAVAGSFGTGVVLYIALLLPVMLCFTWVGARTYGAVSDAAFRRFLLFALVVIGVALVIRTLAVDL